MCVCVCVRIHTYIRAYINTHICSWNYDIPASLSSRLPTAALPRSLPPLLLSSAPDILFAVLRIEPGVGAATQRKLSAKQTERERESERESVCVCMRERERQREREREREIIVLKSVRISLGSLYNGAFTESILLRYSKTR